MIFLVYHRHVINKKINENKKDLIEVHNLNKLASPKNVKIKQTKKTQPE